MSEALSGAVSEAFSLPVFLVEDDPAVRMGSAQALSLAGLPVQSFADAESALAALAREHPGAVVSDVRLPGKDGIALLHELRQLDRELPVILVTGHGDVAMAVQAMRDGAHDFIEKPFSSEQLVRVTRQALEKRALLVENRRLKEVLPSQDGLPVIGQSRAMQEVRRLIAALAPTDVDILINGETGCGKEVVARAIHSASGRRGPFVAINCAALPESVFESEMFGHEAGAFTGAGKRRIGKIEYAHGGTLFLDEIESMPLNLQVKLLRALQERSIERLGGNTPVAVDCRVVAASKADLKALADAGGFRADLYYRLNVVSIDLPPLRQRREDIPLLMAHFLREAAARFGREVPAWSAADLEHWQAQDWPGNVRELKNAAERFCLGLGHQRPLAGDHEPHLSLAQRVDQVERRYIEEALGQSAGNVAQAAELLQLPKKTLYDKLARFAIAAEDFRSRP
ncbi:MAG TPA: sigma-54 dependent transcriptional regulator [Azospira sp.]|nr:sigma-54 dependent transcriptional regulator [Azospira sp.]